MSAYESQAGIGAVVATGSREAFSTINMSECGNHEDTLITL